MSLSGPILKRFAPLLLGFLIGAAPADSSAEAVSAMPPGAFLRSPVPDLKALNRQLQTDKRVVSRYSSLLHLSPEMVRATFAQLHLVRLPQDRTLEVHYVHAGETIGAKVRRVRKGTAVFALPDGTPVLAQVCGNPLRAIKGVQKLMNMLPVAVQSIHNVARMSTVEDAPDFDSTEPLTAPVPTRPKARSMITLRDATPTVEVLPEVKDELAPDEMPADQMKPGEILPSRTLVQANSLLRNWLSGGALLGIARALETHNTVDRPAASPPTNSTPVQTALPTKPGKSKTLVLPLIPEPNSIVFALALTAVLAGVVRRRKSR